MRATGNKNIDGLIRAGNRLWFAVFAVLTLSIVMPASTVAEPDWDFTPQLSVSSSTYKAGAHPELTIGMEKPINFCIRTSGWSCAEINEQQNLRKMTVQFPAGLLADANAAPYCDAEQTFSGNYWVWGCGNEGARVGTVLATVQACGGAQLFWPSGCFNRAGAIHDGLPPVPDKHFTIEPGVVYNARPRTSGPYAGEQGHLVILWPKPHDGMMGFLGDLPFSKTDISVIVRESDTGINSVADDIPDSIPFEDEPPDSDIRAYPGQVTKLDFTIEGDTGIEKGHPLLTNPSFCNPQAIDVEFQGYKVNSWYVHNPSGWSARSGYGDGKTVNGAAPYTATNCDAVPYAPTFTASSSTDAPGATPEITTVITQKDGEVTTKKTVVTLPKGTGVNLKNTLEPCPADALARKACPESSRTATAVAESRLLPVGETLKGDLYLTGRMGSRLTLSLLLRGFVDLRIDGTAGIDNDTMTLAFDNQPAMPASKLTFNFLGGDKSLITNPRRCGDTSMTTHFTSHSGKSHVVKAPMQVAGCSKPTFDVELTEPGKGKRTGLNLEVRSDEKPIKEVKFGIDRFMKLSTRNLGKKRKFGEVSATSAAGTEEAALKRPVGAKQKKGKAFSLRTSTLKGLGINIYRKRFTRKGIKTFKRAKNRKKKVLKKKTVIKNRVSVKQLPSDDLTKVAVSINPDETRLLRNHTDGKICHARFLAIVKTEDGTKYALKQKLRLRGKGCGISRPGLGVGRDRE